MKDLREWIALLEREDELVRVSAEVDPDLEITEIVDRTVKAGGPALLFERPKGSTHPLLINPPGYAPAAFALLAELQGRIGHFPSLIRLCPGAGAFTKYEVAELLNLQGIRERARKRRWGDGER